MEKVRSGGWSLGQEEARVRPPEVGLRVKLCRWSESWVLWGIRG